MTTVDQLLERYGTGHLSNLKRRHGARLATVGERAAKSILQMARAEVSGTGVVVAPISLPPSSNYAMFDLEGLPPQLDDVEKVYLWGLQVFGAEPSEFLPATAGFGVEGDLQGWRSFLRLARRIFDRYGDIPFVHWATYERAKLEAYIRRFGDLEGTAARVLANLVDLLPIVQSSIALPLPSYSLKLVEKYVGFERGREDASGDWAMARYIEATETLQEHVRAETMREILAYNREDLEATWAVFEWLKSHADRSRS